MMDDQHHASHSDLRPPSPGRPAGSLPGSPPASLSGTSGSSSGGSGASSSGGSSASSDSDDSDDGTNSGSSQQQRSAHGGGGAAPSSGANLLRRTPLAAASKPKKLSSGGGKERKRRKSGFPIIPRGQRCGYCHTCINPQMKKACLTKRAEYEKQMKLAPPDGSDAPRPAKRARSSADGGSGGGGSSTIASDSDELTAALRPVATFKGGVKPGMTRSFLALMRTQRSLPSRTLFCTIIGLTDGDVLGTLMAEGVMEVMHDWVRAAQDAISTEGALTLLERALDALLPFPVTLETMKQHKAFTQLLGALRKSTEPTLKARAKQLVDTWMARAPQQGDAGPAKGPALKPAVALQRQDSGGSGSTGAAAHRPQGLSGIAASIPPAKRPVTTTGSSGITQPAKRARIDQETKPVQDPAKALAANAGAAAITSGTNGNHISVVSDNDMFKKATHDRLQHRTGGGRAANGPVATKVQSMDVAEAGKLEANPQMIPVGAAAAAAAAAAPVAAPAPACEAHLSMRLSVAGDETITVSLQHVHPQAPSSGGASGSPAVAGPTQGMRLGSLSRHGAPSAGPTVTRIGAAAAQVPLLSGMVPPQQQQGSAGLEDAPRRKVSNGKRVTWQAAASLVSVRWFKKDDPPLQAQADAALTEAERAAASQQQQHTGFGAAARKEHLNEKQELARQHKAIEQEQQLMKERLQAMQPTISWYEPLLSAPLPGDCQCACGEDSVVARDGRASGSQRRVTYQSVHHCPDTPLEPPDSQGYSMHPFGYAEVLIPLQPSTSQRAQASGQLPPPPPLQHQHQQQQQQQQQQHMGQYGSGASLLHPAPAVQHTYGGPVPGSASLPGNDLLSALNQLKHVLPDSSAAHAAGQPQGAIHYSTKPLPYGNLGAGSSQSLHFPGPPSFQYDPAVQHHQQRQQPAPHESGGPGPDGQRPLQPLPHWVSMRPCRFFASERGCGKQDMCDFKHVREGEDFDVRQLYAEPLPSAPPEYVRHGPGGPKRGGRRGGGAGLGRNRGGGRM